MIETEIQCVHIPLQFITVGSHSSVTNRRVEHCSWLQSLWQLSWRSDYLKSDVFPSSNAFCSYFSSRPVEPSQFNTASRTISESSKTDFFSLLACLRAVWPAVHCVACSLETIVVVLEVLLKTNTLCFMDSLVSPLLRVGREKRNEIKTSLNWLLIAKMTLSLFSSPVSVSDFTTDRMPRALFCAYARLRILDLWLVFHDWFVFSQIRLECLLKCVPITMK